MVGPVTEHSQYLLGGEGEGIDSVSVVQGLEVLAVVEVP